MRNDADASFKLPAGPMSVGQGDLETILAAWENATARLQHTHEILRNEVRRLTDELQNKNRELARKNRLADLGQMASHVAHEVRNGLAPVKLYLNLLRRCLGEQAQELAIVDKAERGMAALETTVTDLLHFTADRDPVINTFPIKPLFEEIVEMLAPQLRAQRIDVATEVSDRTTIRADRDLARRAIFNLVINAVDAMPDGGKLRMIARTDGGSVELEVEDSGAGIPLEVLRRVFEPFFTTKRQGTGLGLAIVYRIAEIHGGEVLASNGSAGGAVFTMRIPNLGTEGER